MMTAARELSVLTGRPIFTYDNVTVMRIVDGDTVRLDIDLGFNTWRRNEPYRLAFINAPELNNPDGSGIKSKDALAALLKYQEYKIYVRCHGKDKYGRWLVELMTYNEPPTSINNRMVELGQAVRE